jgi:NitT/TauT family transport system ATP-binding protein
MVLRLIFEGEQLSVPPGYLEQVFVVFGKAHKGLEPCRPYLGKLEACIHYLLLMDEPYGQMDIKLRFYLEDEVIRLWKELGNTVIFITHNIEEAVYLAERIIILTNKPTTIKEDLKVDLPRPRDVTDPEFIKIRQYVTEQIKWW